MGDKKSILVAYFLLVVGGLLGLHLVYLRRQKHAFVYATTLGWCGLGLIHDLFAIPRYVRESNCVSPAAARAIATATATATATARSSPRASSKPRSCPTHPDQLLRYFCGTCRKAVCGDCGILGRCKGHKLKRVGKQGTGSTKTEMPPFRFGLFVVQVVYGSLLGAVLSCVMPPWVEERGLSPEGLEAISGALMGLGASIGAWLVGSIGKESRSFWGIAVVVSLLGAFMSVGSQDDSTVYLLSFCAAVLSTRSRSYDNGFPYERSGFVALGLHTLALFVFFAVLIYATYNYGTLETTPNQEEPDVKVRVEFRYLMKEIPWDEIYHLFATLDAERFAEFWASSKEQAMLEQSYELLGLTEDATLKELKKRFRTVSAKHHPDVYRGDDREANDEYYYKVVQAFETIEAVHSEN